MKRRYRTKSFLWTNRLQTEVLWAAGEVRITLDFGDGSKLNTLTLLGCSDSSF